MRRSALYAFACFSLSGCITNTNTQTTQNAQVVPVGVAAAARPPAPAPVPVSRMTETARITNARLVTVTKTTTGGATLMLASPQSLARDCSSLGQVNAKVITPPENGTIHIEAGSAFPNYVPGDPPYNCNGHKYPATLISYQSSSGFSGQDTAVVQVFFPDGRAPTIRFQIAVR